MTTTLVLGAVGGERRIMPDGCSVSSWTTPNWMPQRWASDWLGFAQQQASGFMDELFLARRHIPFDVVSISREVGWGAADLTQRHCSHLRRHPAQRVQRSSPPADGWPCARPPRSPGDPTAGSRIELNY